MFIECLKTKSEKVDKGKYQRILLIVQTLSVLVFRRRYLTNQDNFRAASHSSQQHVYQ